MVYGERKTGGPRMAVAESYVIKTTYTAGHVSAGATLAFGLTMNELGVAVGIVSTVAMVVINAIATWRRDRREERQTRAAEVAAGVRLE